MRKKFNTLCIYISDFLKINKTCVLLLWLRIFLMEFFSLSGEHCTRV